MTYDKFAILVVEDNHLIRMLAVDMLVPTGFHAFEAETADEAIGILEVRSDIHLVFTDVQMPGDMEGIKLCHYIRYRWPHIKRMVASGKITIDENDLAVGSAFVSKPYKQSALVANIVSMLT